VWALRQLRELRRDRHVQILLELARRWEGAQMTEALQNSKNYSPEELVRLIVAARTGDLGSPERADAWKKVIVLLRVPNYFEDTGLIARIGRLEPQLLADYFAGVAYDEWELWEPAITAAGCAKGKRDWSARSNGLESVDDRLRGFEIPNLVEQRDSRGPWQFYGLTPQGDPNTVVVALRHGLST
jgi:hypothetical protein